MVDTTAHGTDHDNLIDGRYRIVRKIADGGMATVYQTVDDAHAAGSGPPP